MLNASRPVINRFTVTGCQHLSRLQPLCWSTKCQPLTLQGSPATFQGPEIAKKPPFRCVSGLFTSKKSEPKLQLARAQRVEKKEELLLLRVLPAREVYLPADTSLSACHLGSIHGFIKHHSSSLRRVIKSGRRMALRPQSARQCCSSLLPTLCFPFFLFPASIFVKDVCRALRQWWLRAKTPLPPVQKLPRN